MRTRVLRAVSVLATVVVMAGCSTLPDSGDVHTRPASAEETANQAPYYTPPRPTDGDSQEGIVRGFLLAMQANPPSTAVARSFLASSAKATWSQSEGTIVYDYATVETVDGQVVARLRGAYRLSSHGEWLDGTSPTTITVPLDFVEENGEWRITNPPDVLAVPSTYFSSLFEPFNLYFFDHSGTVLVPTRVYVPRGEATGTNLVRGLLDGPPPDQRRVTTSAFPAGLDLDIGGVAVNTAGIAEVPLGDEVLELSPTELNRLVVQLAWTLRQVPGINRIKLTVEGAPVALGDGRSDISVSTGQEYDPTASTRRDLLAISDGRVVQSEGDNAAPVAGPFGQTGFALRSLAWSTRDHVIAAVSDSGRRVFEAPDGGGRSASRVTTVLGSGTNLLRPAYDRYGGLWVVDNTKSGAVVHLLRNDKDRVLRVRGITGRQVSAFTITRDGTELVAVLATGANPTIEISGLVRDGRGRVRRALSARTRQVSGADLGPARDVAQFDATSVAVLTRPDSGPDQIVVVELDGSPRVEGQSGPVAPTSVPGGVSALVDRPDSALPLRVIGDDRRVYSYAFSEAGRWNRLTLSNVVAATYGE
jgi:hypothetical protein